MVCRTLLLGIFLLSLDDCFASQFEKKEVALAKLLGKGKAFKRVIALNSTDLDPKISGGFHHDVFFTKSKDGKPKTIAVVEKRTYEPNCSHTWVVGIDASTFQVRDIRVVEMSCPHAFPCREASFLDQYKGAGPAKLKSLRKEVTTIAKATGTSQLTTDVVITAISAARLIK